MPMVLKYVDEIARQKRCDVVFLEFEEIKRSKRKEMFGEVDWQHHASRLSIRKWLHDNDIPCKPCAGLSTSGFITGAYQGQIYLDVPYDAYAPEDQQHPLLKKCMSFLEDNAGQVRWKGVKFYGLSLNTAIHMGKVHKEQMKDL